MDAEVIGNVLGRLFVSYALVWLLMWGIAPPRTWRGAFVRTHRWYGLLAALALFVLGMLIGLVKLSPV